MSSHTSRKSICQLFGSGRLALTYQDALQRSWHVVVMYIIYSLIWLYVYRIYIHSYFFVATNIWCNLITAFLHWTLYQTTYSKADLLILFSHQTINWSFITMNFHVRQFSHFSVPRCSQYQVSTSMGAVVLAAVFPLKQHLSPELAQQNMQHRFKSGWADVLHLISPYLTSSRI